MTVLVTRKSPFTGIIHTRELPISKEKWKEWVEEANYSNGPLIQDFFPELSADDREFILTGITPNEWDAAFSEQQDDV